MKQNYLLKPFLLTLILQSAATSGLFAQAGTENQPLTVSEGLNTASSSNKRYWVSGYVVGELNAYSNNKYFYEVAPPFTGSSTFLIADDPEEYDIKKCMTLQFPGSAFADDYCLDSNPEYWKKKITVCGLLQKYNERPGVKSITDHRFESFSQQQNEAIFWKFFESMDEKDYVPESSSSMFAGGIYTGETGKWKLKGATLGTSGSDTKWGRASVRLRKTEGANGDNGYLELLSDKENGLGELRFWAGNYEEDQSKTMAVSVYYSTDKGGNWIPVKLNETIKRGSNNVTTAGMSEYRYYINYPGTARIRIAKADNTTGGINIDNIRISDYKLTNGICTTPAIEPIAYAVEGGICLKNTENRPVTIYAISGQVLKKEHTTYEGMFIPLSKGIYLIQHDNHTNRIAVR